jgi:hypothetical protein
MVKFNRMRIKPIIQASGVWKTFSNINVYVRLLSSSPAVNPYPSNTNASVISNGVVPEAAIGSK